MIVDNDKGALPKNNQNWHIKQFTYIIQRADDQM